MMSKIAIVLFFLVFQSAHATGACPDAANCSNYKCPIGQRYYTCGYNAVNKNCSCDITQPWLDPNDVPVLSNFELIVLGSALIGVVFFANRKQRRNGSST